ncbi:MAG: hypothetical protein JSR73_18865 [Proteobacteria bacterium]|nr:hypothetical protein [Pseudomonadota bacterium]
MRRLDRRRHPGTLVALALLVLAAVPARAARTDWREMTIGRFHVYSTLRDSRTREIARQLQVFDHSAVAFIRGPMPLPDTPTLVYLLDKPDFQRVVRNPNAGGVFVERREANLMLVDTDADFEFTKRAILHEFTHYVQRTTHVQTLPPWYVEGFAELMSSFKLHDRDVRLGEAPTSLRIDPAQWLPIAHVLAVKSTDPEFRTERLMRQFYGESWLLVHYLLFDRRDYLPATGRYLESLDLGIGEADAFANAFSFSKTDLDKALREELHRGVIHVRRYTWDQPITADDAPITRLSTTQADTAFLRAVYLTQRRGPEIDALAAKAVEQNPADPDLRALAARIAASEGKPVTLDELIERARNDLATDAQLRIDLADAVSHSGAGDTDAARRVQALIEPLMQGEAPPLEAVTLWSTAAQRLQLPPPQIIAVLEPASRRAPRDTLFLQQLATANLRAGNTARARELYNQIIAVSSSPPERVWAQKQADSPRMQDPPAAAPE